MQPIVDTLRTVTRVSRFAMPVYFLAQRRLISAFASANLWFSLSVLRISIMDNALIMLRNPYVSMLRTKPA